MLRYILDTNTCIYVIKTPTGKLRDVFNERSQHLCISSVTLAELLYGVEKSMRAAHNLSIVEDFAARLKVLPFDDMAASHYAQIRAHLERKGTPIGPYDLMIAGHARSQGLVLVTRNTREFKRVVGLRIEDWADT